jgi:hypothetical protein
MPVEKQNIFLTNTKQTFPYSGQGSPITPKPLPARNMVFHATQLKRELDKAYSQNSKLTPKQVSAIKYKNGIYLEFSGQKDCDLVVKSLENMPKGIRLLNVRETENTISATVYIPQEKQSFFVDRLEKYLNAATNNKNRIPSKKLIDSIESIRLAMLDSFWIGKPEAIPKETPVWCEIWLRCDDETMQETEVAFIEICKQLQIQANEKSIHFKERIVKLIRANASQLTDLLYYFETMAEIRRFEEPTSFFNSLNSSDQKEFVDDFISRLEYDFSNASVCLLDTGINNGHPLLEKSCPDDCAQAVNTNWQSADHDGHGTEMAGIALFYDLKEKLVSSKKEIIRHHLESVKILPPTGSNDPQLYGAITQDAAYLAETAHPEYKRAICMAVTEENQFGPNDGTPSSWSGAIDALVSGADDGDKRLFFVSAGNTVLQELLTGYPKANRLSPVQSPGQAWNAITVGAYSKDVQITETALADYHAVANQGELSPYSSTSLMWQKKWAIKPEILCDGGNVATDGVNFTVCVDLSLLTTNRKPLNNLFSTINATSSATAQASWMAAQIMAEYPNIWAETVRALLIHSAEWTPEMVKQFYTNDRNLSRRYNLIRACGYGIPNLERAIQCLSNNVNMIIEGEIQPFSQNKKMNEMHLHKIPWANDVLRNLGTTPAKIRITLSYFIEPGPGEIGWKDKYRYPSCQLRFDVKNTHETREDFLKRINVKMREDNDDRGEGSSGSADWFLGSKIRNVGSIHSDFKEKIAVDLCDTNYIAVYPVIGWWRERTNLKCYNKKIRYSLIVSISTPDTKIDLYTPIVNQIKVETPISVST